MIRCSDRTSGSPRPGVIRETGLSRTGAAGFTQRCCDNRCILVLLGNISRPGMSSAVRCGTLGALAPRWAPQVIVRTAGITLTVPSVISSLAGFLDVRVGDRRIEGNPNPLNNDFFPPWSPA